MIPPIRKPILDRLQKQGLGWISPRGINQSHLRYMRCRNFDYCRNQRTLRDRIIIHYHQSEAHRDSLHCLNRHSLNQLAGLSSEKRFPPPRLI
jgi:hypothetical protein